MTVKHRPKPTRSPDANPGQRPRKSLGKRLLTKLGTVALYGLTGLVRLLPRGLIKQLGIGLGKLVKLIFPKRYRLAQENVAFAFPDQSAREVNAIVRGCFDNLGKCMVEFLRLPALCKSAKLEELVTIDGETHLQQALAKGRGVIFLTAHFGNWELIGARMAAAGYPVNVLALEQRDQRTTSLVNSIRAQAGMRVLAVRSGDTGKVLGCLRRGEVVGFLIDQNAGGSGIFVNFFGKLAATHTGAAFFALRTGAAVVPIFAIRNPDDSHQALILSEVELIRTGSLRQDIELNTAAFTRIVEEQVRVHPTMWFWLHNRWKTRPPAPAQPPVQHTS